MWLAPREMQTRFWMRASAEKNPLLVARLLGQTRLGAELTRRGLTLLVTCMGPEAGALKSGVLEHLPTAIVIESFLGPDALAAIFSLTKLCAAAALP